MPNFMKAIILTFLVVLSPLLSRNASANNSCNLARFSKASVYVPLYSHIYFGDALKPFNLAATVSIRNIDTVKSIEVIKANYHNSAGALIRNFVEKPIVIPPLASHSFKVKESDIEGGSGAGVLIDWTSREPVLQPIIESVMIGAASGQGISFTSRGELVSGN